jgi:hypothetical protein
VLVKESANNKRGRWQIECSRHHAETRNSRKVGVTDKQRLDTHNQLAAKLAWKQDEITSSRQAMPSELPDAIPKSDVLFKRNRRRGYTAREAAEEEEKNKRRQAKEIVRQAKSGRAEERAWSEELKRDHKARHSATRAARAEAISASSFALAPALTPARV